LRLSPEMPPGARCIAASPGRTSRRCRWAPGSAKPRSELSKTGSSPARSGMNQYPPPRPPRSPRRSGGRSGRRCATLLPPRAGRRRPHPPPAAGGNPSDAFIQKPLQDKKLETAPQADHRTLIRRLYLDMTGLLPPPEEVEAFVNDASPNAWEKRVDQALASPH